MATPLTEIRSSSIHGMGTFALVKIPAHTTVCEYTGDRMHMSDDKSNHDNTYHLGPDHNNEVIVGDGDGVYINDNVQFRPLTYAETVDFFTKKTVPVTAPHNCEFVIRGKKVFVVTMVDIMPGEELLINYGFKYWFVRYIKASYIDYSYEVKSYVL